MKLIVHREGYKVPHIIRVVGDQAGYTHAVIGSDLSEVRGKTFEEIIFECPITVKNADTVQELLRRLR